MTGGSRFHQGGLVSPLRSVHVRTKYLWFCLLTVSVLLLSAVLPPDSHAQESTFEFWPEVDLYYRFDAQWRLFTLASLTKNREVEYTDGQIGAHLDFSFLPIMPLIGTVSPNFEQYRVFQIRAGYRYSRAFGTNADSYREHRILVEPSVRLYLTEKALLSNRNLAEIRWVNDEQSFRYRNRTRVERNTVVGPLTINPYGSVEFFYDFRYETFHRIQYVLGLEWFLSGRSLLDTSLAYQTDTRSSPPALWAFGVTYAIFL